MLVFSPTFRPLFLIQVLYVTHSVRIDGANDPGFRSLNSSKNDRHIGWKNPKSKLRYLGAMPEQLIGVTRPMNIKFVIGGTVGGSGSRSLFWFLLRCPTLILVIFFLWPLSVPCGGYVLGVPCISRAEVSNPRGVLCLSILSP